jgi:hypothetical protein
VAAEELAAYAQLIFAARAAGADPEDFGGTDLVAALSATGPAPQAAGSESPAAKDGKDAQDEKKSDDGSSSFSTWWIVGVFFVAAMGAGFLLSGRRKNQI